MFGKNEKKGKMLIKYLGDMKFSTHITGDLPIGAICCQILMELSKNKNISKKKFIKIMSCCWDAFWEDQNAGK